MWPRGIRLGVGHGQIGHRVVDQRGGFLHGAGHVRGDAGDENVAAILAVEGIYNAGDLRGGFSGAVNNLARTLPHGAVQVHFRVPQVLKWGGFQGREGGLGGGVPRRYRPQKSQNIPLIVHVPGPPNPKIPRQKAGREGPTAPPCGPPLGPSGLGELKQGVPPRQPYPKIGKAQGKQPVFGHLNFVQHFGRNGCATRDAGGKAGVGRLVPSEQSGGLGLGADFAFGEAAYPQGRGDLQLFQRPHSRAVVGRV